MNSRRWRLEEVDGGWTIARGGWMRSTVEMDNILWWARFVVRHTPPDEQDPHFDSSTPTQVCFLRFAVRHTPPDQ